MKRIITEYVHSRLYFASPWLLAAAAALLITIVVTFAFHNLRLEKQLVTDAMLQKAVTVMRAVQSGARASYISDLRKDFWESDSWTVHVQRVIDHLVDDADIDEIGLVNGKGEIIAHSDAARVGSKNSLTPPKDYGKRGSPAIYYTVSPSRDSGRLFQTIGPFKPFLTRQLRDGMRIRDKQISHFFMLERMWKDSAMGMAPDLRALNSHFFISVGLNMADYDKTISRFRFQIFILSLAMLFVGLGGWVSLSVVQGYRVSQRTLGEVKAFTSLLIANLPVGVIATDRSGRVATWNQMVEELTGIRQEKAVGKPPETLLPNTLASFFANNDVTARSPIKHEIEQEVQLRYGDTVYVLLCRMVGIYDGKQRYSGDMLLLSDISKVKLLEMKMRESERLAAIGKMAGGVAHEVRNPLSSIKGLALLLKNKFSPGSKEQDTAELLIQETERMNRTITEMLSFTSPTSLNFSSVDISELLQRELELLQAETKSAGVSVSLQVTEGISLVNGDKDRLTQVIMNILLNSLQAMEKGGALSIEAGELHDEGMVEIKVRDTGTGMDDETLNQVFYPYYTTKSNGTGLGLAISQRIVADHGGTISLESQPGRGTTVIIRLPVVR